MSLCLPEGFEIEEFRIEKPLGIGGFGITYLARDRKLKRPVAIKEFMPESLVAGRDPATWHPIHHGPRENLEYGRFFDRFCEEAQHIARFNHPNIVPIHRVLLAHRTAYIVMEYLGEISLKALVAAQTRLPEAELSALLAGLFDGLRAVHAAGLLHRDVKPANVMVRGDGTAVLIDFGAARRAHYAGRDASARVVSEGFSPPEQYADDAGLGPWSDIYALAATSYFSMRGEPPAPPLTRAFAVAGNKPDPMVPLDAETTGGLYSDRFLAAVTKGLALAERERPQSVDDWAALFPPLTAATPARAAAEDAPPTIASGPRVDEAPLLLCVPAPPLAAGNPVAPRPDLAATDATLIAGANRGAAGAPAAPSPPSAARSAGRRRSSPKRRSPRRRSSLRRAITAFGALTLPVVALGVVAGFVVRDGDRTGRIEARSAVSVSLPAASPPSKNVQRCDRLATHPDDPQKPANVAGVAFDALTDKAAAEAVEACTAAAQEEPGNPRVRFNLGRAYHRASIYSVQNRQDYLRRAAEAYAAAAEAGHAAAQANLGQMLYEGSGGLGRDERKAVEWLAKSARANFPDAYLTLAHAYATGRGVEQADQRKAYCFLTLLWRSSTIGPYRSFAERQRAIAAIDAADKRRIDERARSGADCL